MNGVVNQLGLGVILQAQGNLSKETIAAAQNLGLLERAGNRAGDVVGRQTRAMSTAVGSLKSALGSLPGLIASVGAGFSAWKLVTGPIDFEHSMARLRATIRSTTTDATVAEGRIKAFESRIHELAIKSGRDAKELAAGVAELYAPLGYEGAVSALPTLGEMIRAGTQDVASAAEGLAVLVKTFNETPEKIGDMLAKTALISGSTVSGVLELMKSNASLMQAAGWSLKDALELAGMVKAMGLSGEQARSFLRQTPMDLWEYSRRQRESAKGAESISDYLARTGNRGFSVVDAQGRLLSGLEVARRAASFIGYRSGQSELSADQKARLADAGMSDALVFSLTRLIPKVEAMQASTENAEGALARFAADMMDDTASRLASAREGAKAFADEIDVVTPLLGDFAAKVTEAIVALNGFAAQHPVTGGVAQGLGLALGAFLSLKALSWGGKILGGIGKGGAAATVAGGAAGGAATAPVLYDQFGRVITTASGGAAAAASRLSFLGKLGILSRFAGPALALMSMAKDIVDRGEVGVTRPYPGSRDRFGIGWEPMLPWQPPMMDSASIPGPEVADFIGKQSTAAPVAGDTSYDYSTRRVNVNVYQLPGESGAALANRVVRELRRRDELTPGARH